jgi:hypothetical protein
MKIPFGRRINAAEIEHFLSEASTGRITLVFERSGRLGGKSTRQIPSKAQNDRRTAEDLVQQIQRFYSENAEIEYRSVTIKVTTPRKLWAREDDCHER